MTSRPVINTHVHVPPNFSAFLDVDDVLASAVRERARVIGASNFHDHRVYRRFADGANAIGIVPIFGLEFITVVDDLRDAGTRVNDPANPGRLYLCGKGVDPFAEPTALATAIDAPARAANRARAARMTELLRDVFTAAGVPTSLDDRTIALHVAARAGDFRPTGSLQERHLAMAFRRRCSRPCPSRRGPRLSSERTARRARHRLTMRRRSRARSARSS
ncbi:MAG: hypothetical protein U0838_14795 [Chloroflexota bacterium]